MPCNEHTVSEWNRDPRWRKAVRVLLDDAVNLWLVRANMASIGRAIRGDLGHLKLQLRRAGLLPDLLIPRHRTDAASAAAGAVASQTVIFQGIPPPVEPLPLPPADPDRATTVVPAPPHL